MPLLLLGKPAAHAIEEKVALAVASLPTPPGLAVLLIGHHPPSETYVSLKRKACAQVGIRSLLYQLPETISEKELLEKIGSLNQDPTVDGILLQLPLPPHLNPLSIVEALDPHKDVDGFHPINMGKLLLGVEGGFIPCTPLGIQALLQHYQIPIEGKDVVIVGRSQSVGKPLAALLMQKGRGGNATVTVVHTQSAHLIEHTRRADILIAAVGIPLFIKEEMVKEGAVVVDVGITRLQDRLVGDVDFAQVEKKCSAITPVPKGVGPMTVAMLLYNTLLSYQRRHSR
jgi:methylenetetrahydrofolate dehydrogenase (NADP+) / methenyltetrahydrofolate cyclohydrolase